ncbi:hypothetical protein HNR59_001046 [Aquamicrobium lusatiense]|uniref:Uncharacterized protein n=1 Tax=Aquamicrobium lusatiense TaxID=89772 RepID=A0A7W9VUH9_9HYPH|nr:hypothetical protein [Aquamicrobium lusatiense]
MRLKGAGKGLKRSPITRNQAPCFRISAFKQVIPSNLSATVWQQVSVGILHDT